MFLRNFHQAYVSAKAEGLPEGYYYPLVHCGTSFGNYKEVRGYLLHSAELRERVTRSWASWTGWSTVAADPRRGRALFRVGAHHASPDRRAAGHRRIEHPRHDPSGLPRLQDGAGRCDL